MYKPTEKAHIRSKMVQISGCMGQRLAGAYRTLQDEETGKTICLMFAWNGRDQLTFAVHETDEYMHLFFEDNGRDMKREHYLWEHGHVELPEDVIQSKSYQRVYQQLLRGITKKIEKAGYKVQEDLTVISR